MCCVKCEVCVEDRLKFVVCCVVWSVECVLKTGSIVLLWCGGVVEDSL